MKRLSGCAIGLALCAQAFLASAWAAPTRPAPVVAAPPASLQLGYDVYSRGVRIGVVDETYRRDGNRYTLSSTTTPAGLLALFKPQKLYLRSNGLIEKRGLRPLHFEQRREGDPGRDASADFDWAARQLALDSAGQRSRTPLPVGTQDRLSAMYQFMFLTLKNSGTVEFSMTNGSKLDRYRYLTGARQQLDTPAGQLDTLYLASTGKPGETRTELWLSTRHYNLPGKMVVTDPRGDQFTQLLTRVTTAP